MLCDGNWSVGDVALGKNIGNLAAYNSCMVTTHADRTRIAVIGAGTIGKTHIDRLARSTSLQLVAIADPTEEAQRLATSLQVPWYADHRTMLDAVKAQGAVVATPNGMHVTQALDCLERGVAALVEKPISDTVAEARQLVKAQARTGVPVLTGHHRRHNPINARARRLIATGALGRIVTANAMAQFYKPAQYFDVAWRREPGGGPILINLIHEVDMLRFLVGEIAEVQAMSSNAVRGFPVEDTAATLLRFENGAIGTMVLSDTTASPWCWDLCAGEQPQYPRQEVQSHFIAGTHGSLSLPDLSQWNYLGAERHWHHELTLSQSNVHAQDSYTRQLEHFAEVIAGRCQPICSAEDGLRTLAACLAVSEAARTGSTCRLLD
jgi:predicted dehydrogenase